MKMSRQVRRQIKRSATGALPVAGFAPVPNQRMSRWITNAMIALAVEMKGKSIEQLQMAGLPTNMAEVQEEAQRRVVRTLPSERMVKRNRPKPSKSDLAAYRKDNGPDLVFA